MSTIDLKDAKAPLFSYAKKARKHRVIVTKDGRPVAAVISLENTDWESVRLCMDPRFMAIIEKARRRRKREGGIPAAKLRREFGL
ncbi:MAG: type II toxin-antitoxin system prevent-host-death family antitoxin [Planctomycetes bacterium]|nr:type II toxin-antitoxin system prevent-host-death family antitoxin [Planctomycetota bacterium]